MLEKSFFQRIWCWILGRNCAYLTTAIYSILAIDLETHKVISLVTGGEYGPMDYDANTGEIYVPDQRQNQLVVLAPVSVSGGSMLPHQPNRTIARVIDRIVGKSLVIYARKESNP